MKLRGKAKARARRKALERREDVVSVRFTKRMYDPLPPDPDPQLKAVWDAVHPILIAQGNPYAPTEPGSGSEEVD